MDWLSVMWCFTALCEICPLDLKHTKHSIFESYSKAAIFIKCCMSIIITLICQVFLTLIIRHLKISRAKNNYIQELLHTRKLKFNPLKDVEFTNSLHDKNQYYKNGYLLKDGLTLATKQFTSFGMDKLPEVNKREVTKVWKTLYDITEYEFSDNVKEELLHFDDIGNLIQVESMPEDFITRNLVKPVYFYLLFI